jgi:hypothetical protein
MVEKVRSFILGLFVIIAGSWFSVSTFRYFTHRSLPQVQFIGIEQDGYYRGIVPCRLKGDCSYKVDHLSVFLDGNKLGLGQAAQISARSFERTFDIDTFTLENGNHSLELDVVDASYNHNMSKEKWNFRVDNMTLKAVFLQKEYAVDQGRTVHVQIQTNKKLSKACVKFQSEAYTCYPESEHSNIYECFIPIDCEEQPNEYLLTAQLVDCVENRVQLAKKLKVCGVNFKKARGFSIPQDKLDSEKKVSLSNKILDQALKKWMTVSPKKKLWKGSFVVPTEVQWIATPYGEIRTTPEKGRYHHAAVDIANREKAVVWAAQDGKVIVRDRYLLSGNTVVIDHGLGVMSLYFHLDSFSDIEVGEMVTKGSPIGKIGKTGYATGYHLHWELRVNNKQVDPLEWTKKTF